MPPLTLAESERLRKFRKKIIGPALTIDTDFPESIHSDEPDAPSSPLIMVKFVARHGLSPEKVFPSLIAPTQLLRQMTHPEQLDQMITVVPVFCSSIDSIRKSILGDMFLLLTCVIYKHLDGGISRANLQLHSHMESIVQRDDLRTAEAMLKASRFVEIIMKKLSLLLRTVETFHRMNIKPLPALPEDDTDADIPGVLDDPSPLIEDGVESSAESPTSDATDSTLVCSEPADGVAASQTTPKGNKHKLIRRILQMAPEPSKAKDRPTENTNPVEAKAETPKSHAGSSPMSRFLSKRSPLAVVNPNPDASSLSSSTTTLVPSESMDENPYVVRQSFIYDCTDPLRPEERVTMPLPAGDTVAIRLDSNGDIKAASLPALVQLLTSHHDLAVDELQETFFLSFRLFSSSHQVLSAIRERWDEPPPGKTTGQTLEPAQQRVWRQHVYHVRGRLARLIFVWLNEYWRPAQDRRVLADLRAFVQLRFPYAHLEAEFIALVLEAIKRAEQDENTPRLQRAKEMERQGAPPAVPALEIELRPEDDYTLNIAVFETTAGRERFAAQITDVAHKLFCNIDPEEAVARWVHARPVFFALQKFEEDLLYWVAQSILSRVAREERVALVEFWLDCATICVRLRNFSSASSIFGGLVFSPVERLSLTILDVAVPSKEQYRKLNAIFDGTNNFAVYRRVLAENDMPAVPLMVVLHKDVISANELSGPVALTNEPDAAKTLIHFSAFRMLKRTICTMESCLVQYKIDPAPAIQDWIRNQLAVPVQSEQLDALSRELEARAPPPIQKGQTWLQTVTGSVETGVFTLHVLPDPGAAHLAPKLRKNKSIATLLNLRTRSK
ncbi:ras guanine nucleotide exchange factor domain-containing protein [Mycena latifolia]|nr:ras guanine nucleotide exchange factor domain-containing protein [Mycena latifolia]